MHRFDTKFIYDGKSRSFEKSFFLLATVLAYVVSYLVVGQNILWKFVDSDQMVIADMALSFSRGVVPEPFFWGQNYLFPIESWLAVPFIWLGMRADIAILMPYPLLIIYFLQFSVRLILQKASGGIVFLPAILFLLVPPKFFITEHLPRNFGTTSALAAISIAHLLTTRSSKTRYLSAFVLGATIASFTACILLLPLIGYSSVDLRGWAKRLIVLTFGYVSIAGMKLFYLFNPTLVGHQSADDSISASRFFHSIVSWEIVRSPFLTVVVPSLILIILFRLNMDRMILRKNLIIQLLIFCLISGMFASEKILNYQESIYFSIDRFWIATPFISILMIIGTLYSSNAPNAKDKRDTQFGRLVVKGIPRIPLMLVVLCLSSLGLSLWVQSNAPQEVAKGTYTGVVQRSDLVSRCHSLSSLMPQKNSYLLVDARIDYFLIYGCRAIANVTVTGFNGDRRTWLRQQLINDESLKVELSDLSISDPCRISFCG
jgi:hypothetical protein